MSPDFSIKKTILYLKSELNGFYPLSEINSFIYLIFNHLFNYSKTDLFLKQDTILPTNGINEINHIVSELKKFKPIQYILGVTEFYNLNFKIHPGVLIPRPETEELVQWVLSDHKDGSYRILDIGSGSGCISISLAKNLIGSKVFAADISEDALSLTRENSKLNNVDLQVIYLDILSNNDQFEEKFDIIISNPPYVTEKEKELMHKNVLDFEPHKALFVPDNDPLLFYRNIAQFALTHLNKNGKIYFEINEQFGKDIAEMLEKFEFHEIQIKKDINGKDRLIKCIMN
ncbi:MAG: protein-(glutamine-N5) methyltransferase, release factor-specific [Bacteroidetes bacterium GWA2_31_9b]|nr:MAG: protein-(glutamine-N5) methyltransferase, release factor-specific [Bacteroidetes bacterium GWA2_31_9b]